ESFDFQAFNVGDYYGAIDEKVASENLTKVLYPNDEPAAGKKLRLEQQYFFVSCSLQDMIRIHLQTPGAKLTTLADKYVAQLNDTHPAVAVAELMRLLVDEHLMGWDDAWTVTQKLFAYTNHTLLPEALEKWPVGLFGHVLPRHLEIVYEINRRFLDGVGRRWPGDGGRAERLSLIDERGERYVRMANLACVGSRAVNGVAALHTELLKQTVVQDFYALAPDKFHNVTNGVTPRRFLMLANPGLAELITRRIGTDWTRDLGQLTALEPLAADAGFRDEWQRVKRAAKGRLADLLRREVGVTLDLDSMFDVQVKRIHEYKRQHLNVLHVVSLYDRLKRDPHASDAPRTVIFGGKAAPGYVIAKLIIRLITAVAKTVNTDPAMKGRLRVVFIPDFNVKRGQLVYPAADLSEQISTAGKEASGTGNMKFQMNGAVTIGTLDGANVEIREEVGADNFFLFGLTAEEVERVKRAGYGPGDYYGRDPELAHTIGLIRDGAFSRGDRDLFRPLVDGLLQHDPYLLFADYRSYVDTQRQAGAAFRDRDRWLRMSILNVARSGKFSSDRAIREYAEKIWHVRPVPVALEP
ncbi:MAG: glycogen/starch/alpha-glucan phosphorylase, partial [Candidatus Rokubacteria bacterium]|nr:glycogen/starch/alpha-glucan phosphorylase [Candidatus Rokubacteria bacterium]